MASLEQRVGALETIKGAVPQVRITITFVSPTEGVVGARLWGGATANRLPDEPETRFLERVRQMGEQHAEA